MNILNTDHLRLHLDMFFSFYEDRTRRNAPSVDTSHVPLWIGTVLRRHLSRDERNLARIRSYTVKYSTEGQGDVEIIFDSKESPTVCFEKPYTICLKSQPWLLKALEDVENCRIYIGSDAFDLEACSVIDWLLYAKTNERDVTRISYDQALETSATWSNRKREDALSNEGERTLVWSEDYTENGKPVTYEMYRLDNEEAYRHEAALMCNCLDHYDIQDDVIIYSLRAVGRSRPVACIEVNLMTPDVGNKVSWAPLINEAAPAIVQSTGFSNSTLSKFVRQVILDFAASKDIRFDANESIAMYANLQTMCREHHRIISARTLLDDSAEPMTPKQYYERYVQGRINTPLDENPDAKLDLDSLSGDEEI